MLNWAKADEMPMIKPSRSELLNLRARKKLAVSGYNVLKKKRDSLIREFFALLKQVSASSTNLEEKYRNALDTINIARAVEGTQQIRSVSFSPKKRINLDIKPRKIMNVTVPKISFEKHTGDFY